MNEQEQNISSTTTSTGTSGINTGSTSSDHSNQPPLLTPFPIPPINLQNPLFLSPNALGQQPQTSSSNAAQQQQYYIPYAMALSSPTQGNTNGVNNQQQSTLLNPHLYLPMFPLTPPSTTKDEEKEDREGKEKDGSDGNSTTTTLANGGMWFYPQFSLLPGNPLVGSPIIAPMSQQGKGKKRKKDSIGASASLMSNKKERRTPAKRDSSGGSGSRSGKGLRLFSMKVCEQVRSKRTTTYNEVANELVKQFMEQESPSSKGHDEKNIRRRVYDALNVLMAVGIITKDKKDIKWQGLPIDYQQEMTNLMDIKKQRLESLQLKGVQLTELIRQQRSLAQLYARNTSPEILNDTSPRINLPFIIVHTDNETSIECEMDTPMTEVFFNFSAPFEIHDDNEILSRLGFDESDQQLLRPQSPQNVSLDQQSVQQQFVDHQNEDNQPSDKVNLVEQAAAAAAVSDSAAVSDNNPQRTQH